MTATDTGLPQVIDDCHELLKWLIPALDKFPRARRFTLGERLPSVSTLRRILARAPDKLRRAPQRLSPKGRPQPGRHHAKPRKSKGATPPRARWAVDTLVRVRDGMRRRLIPFIDPLSRIAFALPSQHSSCPMI